MSEHDPGFPPGPWSVMLVGDQWPGSEAAATLSAAALRRGEQADALERYADEVRTAREVHLAPQDGIAAEALRHLFGRGEQSIRDRADRNRIKADAYRCAQRCLDQLRADLTGIAADGNARIETINRSEATAESKAAAIAEVVAAARSAAAARVAGHADSVYAAVQSVLGAQGLDGSARMFAAAHGVPPR